MHADTTPRRALPCAIPVYARDALSPTPPASGGTGKSPLLSATNAPYLSLRFPSESRQRKPMPKREPSTHIRRNRSRSSAGTDGRVTPSTRSRCPAVISCVWAFSLV